MPEDLGGVIEIENSCFTGDAWSEESFLYVLNEKDGNMKLINFVAEEEDGIAGYIAASEIFGEMSIDSVAVKSEHRRKGIARKLIELAIDEANPDSVILEVRESNASARALYRALGFEEIFIRKDYYSLPTENAVIMKLEINKEK